MPAARGTTHLRPSDLRGIGRAAIDATLGVTNIVEALHDSIARLAPPVGQAGPGRTRGLTGLVYRTVRGVTGLVGSGLDAGLKRLEPMLADRPASEGRDAALAALNGVLGDYLADTSNTLAIPMALRRGGVALAMDREALAAAIPKATGRVAILIHGLCMNDRQWRRDGHDHGECLAREAGCTPLYLHYNTGRSIAANGRELATLLDELCDAWPVPLESLLIVGHSMGGLVARSAMREASTGKRSWLAKVEAAFFLGTPHLGAPLERGGNGIHLLLDQSPYTAPFARLARLRSHGITDLRHGTIADEERTGPDRFAHRSAPKASLRLPRGIRAYAIAATTASRATGARVPGDGLVPLASALGRHPSRSRHLGIPKSRQWIVPGTGHLELLSSPETAGRMIRWLESPG